MQPNHAGSNLSMICLWFIDSPIQYWKITIFILTDFHSICIVLFIIVQLLYYVQIRSDQSLSRVRFFVIPWTVAPQAPLSMGFSRQEYWSGLPCPPPGDLSNSGIKPVSLTSPALGGGFFTTSATSSPVPPPRSRLHLSLGMLYHFWVFSRAVCHQEPKMFLIMLWL